jgi:hypothetical protein
MKFLTNLYCYYLNFNLFYYFSHSYAMTNFENTIVKFQIYLQLHQNNLKIKMNLFYFYCNYLNRYSSKNSSNSN